MKENNRESLLWKITVKVNNADTVRSIPVFKLHHKGLTALQTAFETVSGINPKVENFADSVKVVTEELNKLNPVKGSRVIIESVKFIELVDETKTPQVRTVKEGSLQVTGSFDLSLDDLMKVMSVIIHWNVKPERGRKTADETTNDLSSMLE